MDTNRIKGLMVYLFLIAICFCFFSFQSHAASRGIIIKAKTSSGTTKEIQLYSGYHALVVGCGDYQKGWPHLPNPVKDAKEVASLLKSIGWTVDVLTNPNEAKLNRELNKLVTGPGRSKEKAIFLWYSGHGMTIEEADGTKLGYLVPVDAPNPDKDLLGFMERAISMRQIETVSKQIKSKHVLMVFDSCFSGAIFQMVRARPSAYIQEKVAYPVRQFITAGTENEQVPDKSVFKDVFVQGIKENFADLNKDSYITGEELGAYLQEKVINYSRKAQHPQFGKINNPKLDKGDFVFVKSETSEIMLLKSENTRLNQENEELKRQMDQMQSQYELGGKQESPKVAATSPEVSKPKVIARDAHFIKYDNGVVEDTKTGLEWYAGPDKLVKWQEVKSWISGLKVDGGRWRMPSIKELRTLYQRNVSERNMTELLTPADWHVWSGNEPAYGYRSLLNFANSSIGTGGARGRTWQREDACVMAVRSVRR